MYHVYGHYECLLNVTWNVACNYHQHLYYCNAMILCLKLSPLFISISSNIRCLIARITTRGSDSNSFLFATFRAVWLSVFRLFTSTNTDVYTNGPQNMYNNRL